MAADALAGGAELVVMYPRGNSMTPLIQSGQRVVVRRLSEDDLVEVGDVVLAKVRGRMLLHLVTGVDGQRVQVSNNHGHVNGWTVRSKVYGKWDREL